MNGAKGADWNELAKRRLAGVVALIEDVEVRLAEAEAAVGPLLSAVNVRNDDADALLLRLSDAIWNEVPVRRVA